MAENVREDTFHFTVSEFYFITQMLGLQHIAGFTDPFPGYLIEELEEEFSKVRRQLMDRGVLLEKEGSEELEIDELLGLCLACCGSDTAVYLKKTILGEGDYEAFLYFTPSLVVERTWSAGGVITISPLANPELTMNILAKFFPLTLHGATPVQVLLKDTNANAWEAATEPERESLLKERLTVKEEIDFLLRLEGNPDRSGTMAFWTRYGASWGETGYRYRQQGEDLLLITEPGENELSIQDYRPGPVLAALERLAAKYDLVNEGARA